MTGFGDLYPQAILRWNNGVNNWMAYATGDIPVGAYNSTNLANIGIGHGAVDAGGGYTYFDPQTGHEFSAVTRLYLQSHQSRERITRAASTGTWIGARRNFCPSSFSLVRSAMSTSRSAPTAAPAILSGCFQSRVFGRRPADRLHLSDRTHAGLSQSEGLRRIRRLGSAFRLEREWLTLSLQPSAPINPRTAIGHQMTI